MWEELVNIINDMIEKYNISEEDQILLSDAVEKCYTDEDVVDEDITEEQTDIEE
jgi:hypothetical protein